MRGKSKLVRCVLVFVVALFGVLAFASCTPSAAPSPAPTEAEKIPSVLTIPNVIEPKKSVTVAGADFEPGEKVKVVMLMSLGPKELAMEQNISYTEKEGQFLTVDANGSFKISTAVPPSEGIWPIRVYDEEGKMVAVTLVWTKAAAK